MAILKHATTISASLIARLMAFGLFSLMNTRRTLASWPLIAGSL